MFNCLLKLAVTAFVLLFLNVSYAASLWTKIPSNAFPPSRSFSQIKVSINVQDILGIAQGDSFEVPIGNKVVTITFDEFKNDNGVLFLHGFVQTNSNERSDVMLIYSDGKITGHIILEDKEKGFDIDIDVSTAQGFITEYVDDYVFCEMPVAQAGIESDDPELQPAPSDVFNLSSTNDRSVLYLDFDGENVSDSTWTKYNNFQTIRAKPFDLEGNPDFISGTERANIFRAWEIVSEDFRPFAVNVTTSRAKFNAAPRNRRQQVIITPTNFYGNVGGIATFDSFSRNADTAVWAFSQTYHSARSIARTISHEAGHALSLRHDGLYGQEYHPGSGSGEVYGWGPIMGAAFFGRHIQWSRGDYAGATNNEDDIAKIAQKTGRRADSYPNGSLARTKIEGTYNGYIGVGNDRDVFYVDAKKDSKLDVVVTVNELYSDLDSEISVYNAAGRLLARKNDVAPFNKPQKLGSSMNFTFPSDGRYFIYVRGGAYTSNSYRWSRYGSVGRYQITGKVTLTNGNVVPIMYLLLLDDET